MRRETLSSGITRVCLSTEDAKNFSPISFTDRNGEYLRQTVCVFRPRPVYRLPDTEGEGEVLRTENGEVLRFDGAQARKIRSSFSVTLRFEFPGKPVLTGLGAHEDGIYDYSRVAELLYEHNMKIPVPFLLSSDGWGLYLDCGCAMKYRGEGNAVTFELDAAESVPYLVIRGEKPADVLRMLMEWAGKPAMLPKWAFGYIQSKEHYKSAEELTAVSKEFRRRKLPLDCIVQDWMSWKDGLWGDKTPDPERFPDVSALTEELHREKVQLMVSVWPNMDSGPDSEEFQKAGLFLPASRIYDAFSEKARDLYWAQCRRHWMNGGADALWCDSDEPITDPDWCGEKKRDPDTRYRLITEAASLRMDPETMNDYADRHLRGLWEHWLRDFPEKRPMLLSRSGSLRSGSLGTVLWSGDISARFDVLEKQVTEAVRVSLSGISWWTVDIGAFFVGSRGPWFCEGDYPLGVQDPAYRELYVRWFQFGAMLPVFRSHGTETPREPWRFGADNSEEYRILRETLALRYRLLPYIYSEAAKSCETGLPMIRAMLMAFPEDQELRAVSDQYLFGDALLVKPVTKPLSGGGGTTDLRLPQGLWYDVFGGGCVSGGRTIPCETPLGRFPLFVRAGSILPVSEGAESTADLPMPARELVIYCGADGETVLYDDSGDGMEYLHGAYIRIPLRYKEKGQSLLIGKKEGSLPSDFDMLLRFRFPDGTERRKTVHYSGEEIRVRPL